jgi:hypothetical protein
MEIERRVAKENRCQETMHDTAKDGEDKGRKTEEKRKKGKKKK